MNNLKLLSRSEMRNIKGGDPGGGTIGCNGLCLVCETPGGTEIWCRSSGSGSATDECKLIYPAYGNDVCGTWETCGT